MNTHRLTSTLATLAGRPPCGRTVDAQYAPPAPLQPFPGFINTYLRNQDAYLANWDIGGSVPFPLRDPREQPRRPAQQ
jgi:hypothetical protein